ncbi:uncharacterized protein LOC106870299 [Octopus bimaculoides]|uniref:uncharacterized protein LOC106870299 n=1 Tax=Octopus bimaculoides TaxID=37653 RepID=UPI00071C915F|nr:uncharacterized protein LOC106870299 [Octopus bimaculoides]|eukprot:XP_014771811.1 PREDICTED: uncharacterized protein LOC106870299 [Octopus bimaculoides]
MTKLNTVICQHRNNLTAKVCDYLTNFNCKTRFFYGLPKIHKNKIITEACKKSISTCITVPRPTDLKMRPIVAGPNCETHRLSNFIDILLKPILKCIPSIVRDDLDLLNHLPKHTNKDIFIVSFDVINLYTTIPHQYGLETIKFWLEKYSNEVPERIRNEFMIEGLKFILQNNFLNFNNNTYRQVSGTAMVTKFAPTYANLVMAYLELQIYEEFKSKYGLSFHKYLLENWKCYLDCLILWSHTLDQFIDFKNLINSVNNHIQFTMEYSQDQLPFLDILIIKKGINIETDIHYRPTDSKQYPLFTSNHPKYTKTNIPFNLARRICTTVSNYRTRNKRLQELKAILLERHYPASLVDNGIERAKTIATQDLRKSKHTHVTLNSLPHFSTHNPRNAKAYTIRYKNIPQLSQDPRLKKCSQPIK